MAGARNIGRAAACSVAANATAVGTRSSGRSGACSATDDGIFILDFSTLADGELLAGGDFRNTGLDWTKVFVTGGVAHGTQDGSPTPPFKDSYAMFTRNFGANYRIEATVHLASGITTRFLESNILYRWIESAHSATGYESTWSKNNEYDGMGTWPASGALGTSSTQYRNMVPAQPPHAIGIADGDIFYAQIVGNVINVGTIRGGVDHPMYTVTDTDPDFRATGQPALGFFRDDNTGSAGSPADSLQFGFTRVKIIKL